MRAVVCHEFGPPELLTLEDRPEPEPGPGEVQVAVRAVGVNFVDVLMCAGGYQLKPELPFVPGLEAAGTVRKLGPGVTGVQVGDRVISGRSEEHTSELQSLMRISYAVFCLKKNK